MTHGEDAILNLLGKYFPNSHPHFVMGRGDDCALITVPFANAYAETSCDTYHSPSIQNTKSPALNNAHLLAVTSDIFTENAHFRTRYFTPAQIGHKALAVNISDLAANGARPSAFSLNLTLTDQQDFIWLEEFFASMAKLSNLFDMGLSGGDLAKSPSAQNNNDNNNFEYIIGTETISALNIGITAWGDYGHGGIPLLRHKSYALPKNSQLNSAQTSNKKIENGAQNNGQKNFTAESLSGQDFCIAKEGDYIFVIGEIGLARAGLFALENSKNKQEVQDKIKQYPVACNAHLSPIPLVAEGLFLSQFAITHPIFLMDISDGLMRDLPRLLARQGILPEKNKPLGAKLHITEKDLHQEVLDFAKSISQDSINFAYSGGEDYGLLGICPKEAWGELQKLWQDKPQFSKLWKIGEVCQNDITLNNTITRENGFDHFHR